ncbi:MAG: branched-chain amino acid ABC transporter substrate-binding protein [Candidatus Colwellbacteria bacterium]|nr:branched-chain amino acid ABC transporter substrate-binding protein [Candidatus Colwellbacteria bacterium]
MTSGPIRTKVVILIALISLAVILISAYFLGFLEIRRDIDIVVSMPMRGTSVGPDAVNGMKLALEESGYKSGGRKIELTIKDDGNEKGEWLASKEWEIATEAAGDKQVMVYVGPFNSGAAKISIPITNGSGLPQVSPGNTWPGLTKPGFSIGEPEAFYPTRIRTYFRVCPTDDLQGPAAANWAKELGFQKIYIFDDGQAYGKGIADLFEKRAYDLGLEIYGHQTINTLSQDITENIEDIRKSDIDLIYFGGITTSGAIPLLSRIKEAGIRAGFMGSDGLMEQAFIDQAGMTAEGAYITQVGIPPSEMTGKGREFVDKYRSRYSIEPGTYSGFGYEAMNTVIAAIEKAKNKDRAGILDALSKTSDHDGIFGKWSFDVNGDTSLSLVSGNRIQNREFVFQKLITEER